MNTVQIELGVLKQILSHAVLAGDIDVNPAAEVRRSRRLPKKKRTALTEEQEVAVENYRGKDYLLGLMLLYTGARRGELLALNWQVINHLDKTITISKKLNYGYGNTPHLENRLKNSNSENNDGEKRVIPLLAPLADALPRNRIGKVFTNDDGEYLTASQLNSRWKEYCRNVGLTEWVYDDNGKATETFPVTPHCFRHSFATICFEAGVDAKTTAAYIGDTEQVARDIYTELRKRHSTTGAERVDAYLEMRRMGRADEA
jgi:integrase